MNSADRQRSDIGMRDLQGICNMQDELPIFSGLELVLIKSSMEEGKAYILRRNRGQQLTDTEPSRTLQIPHG